MSDRDDHDPDWDLSKVRPVTKSLIQAIFLDVHPTPAAATDFGITSQQHYEAIYYPARNDEISFAQLDAAYGNGPRLTELVNACPSNPHKGIEFSTPWDVVLGREETNAKERKEAEVHLGDYMPDKSVQETRQEKERSERKQERDKGQQR